jgi:hypothetical protein
VSSGVGSGSGLVSSCGDVHLVSFPEEGDACPCDTAGGPRVFPGSPSHQSFMEDSYGGHHGTIITRNKVGAKSLYH